MDSSVGMDGTLQLDWIKTFVAIVDSGGFAVAADTIYRSQSRVSAHIASLEDELGATLFDRRQHPVALTDSGQAFLGHARAILVRLDAGYADLASVQGRRRGRVALGTYPSASAAFLPAVIAQFGQQYPGIQLDLVELSSEELASFLIDDRVALAFRPTVPSVRQEGIEGIALWREPLDFVFPTGHPKAVSSQSISFAALSDEKFIAPRAVIDTEQPYMSRPIERQVKIITEYPQTLIALVQSGLGIGITNHLALEVSNQGGVTVRQVADTAAVREVGVYWNTRSYRTTAADALYESILSAKVPAGVEPCRRTI